MNRAPASSEEGRTRRAWIRRHRKTVTLTAAATVLGLPSIGFLLAPSAHADDSPGANLAGINASAYGTAVQVQPLTPGVVGAGNVSQGNLIEADIPYASTASSTGPTSTAVASPAYPGDTAAGAGNALGTFAPQIPAPLLSALNDPVLARADYPAQVSTGTSSTYSPPAGGAIGLGNATATAADSGSDAQAATSQTAFQSAGISVSSSTATSQTVLDASTVTAKSHTDVGAISILGGLVKIAGISSDASSTSDGNNGQPDSDFNLGAVTVAGVPASIGPNGITIQGSGPATFLVPDANQALVALKQAGISVHTIAPTTTLDGASAAVTSGALVVQFQDANVPNPNGQVPVSSLGLDLNIGLSQASADATGLPPLGSLGSIGSLGSLGSTSTGSLGGLGGAGVSPSGAVASVSSAAPTGDLGSSAAPSVASIPAAPTQSSAAPPSTVLPPMAPAAIWGVPVKAAWVVIAFLLSLVISGPLLGYANWQLLRGRKT